MDKQQILDAIKMLAQSQGFYGRLYEAIKDNDEALKTLAEKKFKDAVDLVLFFEQ